MTNKIFRYFSANDVRKSLPMVQAIEAVKEAFIQLSANRAEVPPRIHIEIPEHSGGVLFMPVYLPDSERVGLKFLSLFGDNPERGLPFIHALVAILDAQDGQPLALMDGSYLTALRTGAGTGVATDLLARSGAQAVAVFGAGVQGRTQLEAVCAVRQIKRGFVFDINTERAQSFALEMSQKYSIPVSAAVSPEELLNADIVCTATTSSVPVFSDKDLKPGVHINAIGSYQPYDREIPGETVLRARVFVDHRKSCLSEAGDLLIPIQQGLIKEDHIYAEIGEVAARGGSGRKSENEITLYKSVGNAVQDLAAANRVLEAADKLNLGVELS